MTGATFTVHRHEDVTGISGSGVIAEGWESSDGKTVVLKWLTATPSVCIYEDVRHIELIHGHGGKTQIVWDSPTQYTPTVPPPREPKGVITTNWDELLGKGKYGEYPDHDAHDPRD